MSKSKYRLEYCEWRQPDNSLLKGFCLHWQSESQVGPSFFYYDRNGDDIGASQMPLGPRVFYHVLMEFKTDRTWQDVKPNLGRLSGLVAKVSGRGLAMAAQAAIELGVSDAHNDR